MERKTIPGFGDVGDDKQNRIRKQIEKLLGELEDPRAEVRLEVWLTLARMFQATRKAASTELIFLLVNHQDAETDDHVWRAASRTISLAFLQLQKTARRANRGRRPIADLGEWLWNDFRRNSRVFRVADPERYRRDEEAVIEIARSLSLSEFPRTEFICVDPGGFAKVQADLDRVNTICFVGRLWLYGVEAMKRWGIEALEPRYRYGLDMRPPGLRRGELHPEYHAVVRRATDSEPEKWYRTRESADTRTDYGLVRRYVVSWNGRHRVVIHIAGCSSLGTQAAAHYAAYTLLQPELDDKMLPVPPNTSHSSRVEILVKAVAGVEGSSRGWRICDLKPLDLRVDDYVWSQDENRWYVPSHDVIRLVFPNSHTVQNHRQGEEGAEILFDDDRNRFRRKSENSRLCTSLCMLAKDQHGVVQLSQLGNDVWIWNNHKARKDEHVRNRLGNLRRVMGKSLTIDGGACRVIPEIRVDIQRAPEPTPPAQRRRSAASGPTGKRGFSQKPKPK